MQSKISKTLDRIIAETIERLSASEISTSYLDRLVVELLGDDATFAYRLLAMQIGDHGVGVVLRRLIRSIGDEPHAEQLAPMDYYLALCDMLRRSIVAKRISTAHVLYVAAADFRTATSEMLRSYGIDAMELLQAMHSLDNHSAPMDSDTQILKCRKRSNPILIEEPSVGKRAIAAELAQSIADGRISEFLAHKGLSSADAAVLVAGANYQGENSVNIGELVKAIESSSNIVIVINARQPS